MKEEDKIFGTLLKNNKNGLWTCHIPCLDLIEEEETFDQAIYKIKKNIIQIINVFYVIKDEYLDIVFLRVQNDQPYQVFYLDGLEEGLVKYLLKIGKIRTIPQTYNNPSIKNQSNSILIQHLVNLSKKS